MTEKSQPPSDAATEYGLCERYIDTLRAAGVPRDNLEDPVLERMDVLWLQMTEEERAAAKQRVGSHELPRIEVVREKE